MAKLNCDGVVCGLGSNSSAGGVIRNHDGNFSLGFASNLGSRSVIKAELHAIRMGIQLARLKGFQKAVIEFDSLFAIRFVKDGCSSSHPLFNLISDIQDLLLLERNFCLEHVLCEANQVVDCFAKYGLNLDSCSRCFSCIPYFASSALKADLMGTCFPRGY